jgi:hypothetical protein
MTHVERLAWIVDGAFAMRSTIAELADMPDRSLYAHDMLAEDVRGSLQQLGRT